MGKISFSEQFYALFQKNTLEDRRSKMYAKESIIPVILFILYMYSDSDPDFWEACQSFSPYSIIVTLNYFVYKYVTEKQNRTKETFKIMGMQEGPYQLSWLATLYGKIVAIWFFLIVAVIIFNQYENNLASSYEVIAIQLFYMLAAANQSLVFCSLFSNAKIATSLYGLLFVVQSSTNGWAFKDNTERCLQGRGACDKYDQYNRLMSFMPQYALTSALSQTSGLSFKFKQQVHRYTPQQFNLRPIAYLEMLIIDTFIYFILYAYLSQVMPNEYGTQKSVFFPITSLFCCGKKKKNNQNQLKTQLLDNEQNQGQSDDYSNAIYHQNFDNPQNLKQTIRIKNLRKNFGSFHAVDGVDMCLYERQIFCLLGHNGAGKTTTINLLTGMLPKSKGEILIEGRDIDYELDVIRQNVGLCSQKDALYDDISVQDHLELMCKIKGVPEDQRADEIQRIMEKCMLVTERGKFTKNLSGGNKRKLSLAMALIGDSSILFLDEPSSGLDPSSRRILWDILKEVKSESRTIILTTHHLEEAEELSERIGIMAKGKLLTVGDTDFIKKKFGIGYHLEINMDQAELNSNDAKYEQKRQQIINLVKNGIQGSKFNPQSTKEILKFILPFDQRKNFSQLFEQVEQFTGISMNLEINSLEEAFVNIGMEEERLLEQKDKEQFNISRSGIREEQQQLEQVPQDEEELNYTNFNKIQAPPSLEKQPVYSFNLQFKAIFKKRFYNSYKAKTQLIGIVLSVALVFTMLFFGAQFEDRRRIYDDRGNFLKQVYVPTFEAQQSFAFFGMMGSVMLYSIFNIVQLVQEKFDKQKYALNVMGCRSVPYWVGNFVFDYIMLTILVIFFVIGALVGGSMSQLGGPIINKVLFYWVLTFVIFNIAAIACSYALATWFKKTSMAQIFSIWLMILIYMVPKLSFLILERKMNSEKYDVLTEIMLTLSPYFALGKSAFLIVYSNRKTICGTDIYRNQQYLYHYAGYTGWIKNEMVIYINFLVFAALVFWYVVRVDQQSSKLQEEQTVNELDEIIDEVEPEIKEEQERLEDPNCDDIVKVHKLSKIYPNGFTAIKNNNFGVKKGEIFGLLGPNGAGKSTTFNIITSQIPKTDGSVKLKNIEVDRGIMDIYQNVGICPQFDSIWPTLTVQQHLVIFGMMKGLEGKDLTDQVEYYLQVMQLSTYRNVNSGRLSGGNKRKLCVTLALIGGPDMQFFDEPSSGVDPIAKRFLWNSLTQNLKLRDAAITLTTHSMIEAESLSHKIGILINGKMHCYGTPDFLKKKYGEGYIITLNAKHNNQDRVWTLIKESFPEATNKLQDSQKTQKGENQDQQLNIDIDKDKEVDTSLVVQVPYENFSFYRTFDFYDKLLEAKEIDDFAVSQSSLEKIFLEISKLQHTNPGLEQKKKKKRFGIF